MTLPTPFPFDHYWGVLDRALKTGAGDLTADDVVQLTDLRDRIGALGDSPGDRLRVAVDKSLDAFWLALAWHYPEARSHERDGPAAMTLRRVALDAAALWAELNLGVTLVGEDS